MASTPRAVLTEVFPPAIGGSAELLWNVHSRLSIGNLPVLTQANSSDASAPADGPFRITRVPFEGGLGLVGVRPLASRIRIARTLRRLTDASTVVHCGRVLPEGLAAAMARRQFICWTHGEELPIIEKSRELSWLMRGVHRLSAAVIANSHHTADLLARLGTPASKVHVVHPGVDSDRFSPSASGAEAARRVYASPGEILLVAVGRLQARKGHDLTLRAIASLAFTRIRYVVAGDGPERARLEALSSSLGIADRVRFLGSVSRDNLPALYAAADIFVHPNRVDGEDFEGFGLVFLEAAASGRPAIGGRTGGVPEAVIDGETGVLVSGNDVHELANAIRRLAASAPLRQSLGQAARRRAIAEFSWDGAAARVLQIDEAVRSNS